MIKAFFDDVVRLTNQQTMIWCFGPYVILQTAVNVFPISSGHQANVPLLQLCCRRC